mgnify:CR=1 FL=1
MQKGIVIPKEQYYKMLESYDRIVKELEELKKKSLEPASNQGQKKNNISPLL